MEKPLYKKCFNRLNKEKNLAIILFIIVLTFGLTGCSSSNDDVYYSKFPDILDFGEISGVEPEITEDQNDRSVTYIYQLTKDADKSKFDRFIKNLEKKDYEIIVERKLGDNGLIYNVYQNDRFQLIVGENYSDNHDDAVVLISIRERYYRYAEFPSVPDYGVMNNIEPSKVNTEKDDSGKDVTVYIYRDSTKYDEYVDVLLNHEFSILEEKMSYEDGYLTIYSNQEYYVIVGAFPTLTMITVGYLE